MALVKYILEDETPICQNLISKQKFIIFRHSQTPKHPFCGWILEIFSVIHCRQWKYFGFMANKSLESEINPFVVTNH